jgi:DNA-directed RNA polymerase specialized sigma24 family protein
VLQEGAVIALRKLDQFRAGTSFVAWMGRIVQYVALNHARRRRRLPVTMGEHDDVAGGPVPVPRTMPSGLGELPIDQIAFDDDVVSALDGLVADARACLLLRTRAGGTHGARA